LFECGALLDLVIAYEPENMALRKDDSFFIYRAVLEAKNRVASHAITTGELRYITLGEDIAFERA
jgi:hypothetical protein